MKITKEILNIEDAFRLLVLHYEDEECAIDMAKEVLVETRRGENKEFGLMLAYVRDYGGGIVRLVTAAEVEVLDLHAGGPYYVSLL